MVFWNRHGSAHLAYSIPESVKDEILALPNLEKGKEYWFDSELLIKTKAKDTKGKIVLFDILQDGKYLFLNPDQEKRIEILDNICGKPRKLDDWRGLGYQISENILMAPTFQDNFVSHFNKDMGDEVEGLVLRRKNSVLDNFGQKPYNVTWIIRCRKPHKNYNF